MFPNTKSSLSIRLLEDSTFLKLQKTAVCVCLCMQECVCLSSDTVLMDLGQEGALKRLNKTAIQSLIGLLL